MTRLPTEEGLAPGTAGGGRQRLFKAALRLAAKSRSIHAIGVRELGRQAGLNPNTFYRHFPDIEALTLALIAEIGSDLRRTLRELRRQAAPRQELATRTVQQVFDFALNQPEAISVAVRELHGPSAATAVAHCRAASFLLVPRRAGATAKARCLRAAGDRVHQYAVCRRRGVVCPRERRAQGPKNWSGREDLNLRPPPPQGGALPGCATPRQ